MPGNELPVPITSAVHPQLTDRPLRNVGMERLAAGAPLLLHLQHETVRSGVGPRPGYATWPKMPALAEADSTLDPLCPQPPLPHRKVDGHVRRKQAVRRRAGL